MIDLPQTAREKIENFIKSHPGSSAFVQSVHGESLYADEKEVQFNSLPETKGVVLRLYVNGEWLESAGHFDSSESIDQLIQKLEDLKESAGEENGEGLSEEERNESFPIPEVGNKTDDEKISQAREKIAFMKGLSSAVKSAALRYRFTWMEEEYISQKKHLYQKIPRFEVIVRAVVGGPKGGVTSVHDGFARQGGWEHAEFSNELVRELVSVGEKIADAPRLDPGEYDCVFTPSLSGILAHEAFGHGTEGDTMLKGRAKGSDYLGKRVASDLVTMVDSPAFTKEAASYFFDHEGEVARDTVIVEKGFLKNPMADWRSAELLGIARTPNGRRESFDHKVYTRMTNTIFLEGKDNFSDMIASIENGFLIDHATNGMEDPKGWGIQVEALYAERIRDGKLTGEIFSPVIITGYVPDILQSISMVSEKTEINGLGMCGKGHKEWVKVTDGGPYLKLRALLA